MNSANEMSVSTLGLTLQEAMDLTLTAARRCFKSYSPKITYQFADPETLAQSALCWWLERNYFGRFDGRTTPSYFIFVGMRNFAIQEMRKLDHRPKTLSVTVKVEDEEVDLLNVIPEDNYEHLDINARQLIGLALKQLSSVPLHPGTFSTPAGPQQATPAIIFALFLMQTDRSEIAIALNLKDSVVNRVVRESQATLAKWYVDSFGTPVLSGIKCRI